ncbi:pyruvate ferredoxin oxidoreductase gamma subunit [Dehalogenimonas formicexedens]|uniref:Pyruvate ferredoxin oxidoreductase gamma subunit n=2 Tax=Dehalogenimonas formicexedens TaxID=1839801 RepID=A0A1P8F6M6_9CHLR|nr:pyruvate ferredoxin oxidoreductase gamma subunit [Dehalogenimonas formicexedens]
MAYNRINQHHPIRNRAGITQPDVVVVLDPSLLAIGKVTSGLKDGGTVVINTSKAIEAFPELSERWNVAIIDATRIAREELGVPIVNTTMLGALLKATGAIDISAMTEPLKGRFGRLADKNIKALKRAFEETQVKELKTVG